MSFAKKHRGDILLILVLLLIAGAVWGCTLLTREEGAMAVVTVDGTVRARLALDIDTEFTVGEADWNTVVVRDGAVCVSGASCPDHLCVNQSWIRYDGETIVCLPNKLIVSVEGGSKNDMDAVSQ